jgi:hypothetical protein
MMKIDSKRCRAFETLDKLARHSAAKAQRDRRAVGSQVLTGQAADDLSRRPVYDWGRDPGQGPQLWWNSK